MNESYMASCKVWAIASWCVVAGLIGSAWVVLLFAGQHWRVGFLLGGTGCTLAAVAATLHIRSFAVRVCALIRATPGMAVPDSPKGLHPIR